MKEVRKNNISAYGISKSCKSGFTLIEIVVVIAVIGILMGVAITQLQSPGVSPVQSFADNIFTLVKNTQISSLQSHRTHRIVIGLEEQSVYVEQATNEYDASGNPQFVAIAGAWQSRITIPDELEFLAVYVNGVDELAGGVTERIWIYCYPSGMLQQTRIVIRDTSTGNQHTIQINPVTADVQVSS